MAQKICPSCGAVQQWEMWRQCPCGHVFEPSAAASHEEQIPPENKFRYFTFWRRFWASFVDVLVFLPLGFVEGFLSSPERGSLVLILWSTISHIIGWLYSVLLHARYGQTLGKMLTGVKVLDLSEERIPSFRQALLRDIGPIVLNALSLAYVIYLIVSGKYGRAGEVSTLPFEVLTWAAFGWALLEIITMATDEKRRALHDYIAGTVVVRSHS